MGKNASGQSEKPRRAADSYDTPYSVTEQLLQNEHFSDHLSVLEPAAGRGAMAKVLAEGYKHLSSYDLFYPGTQPAKDFLFEDEQYNYVITNPPYSLSLEFILKCKQVAQEKFALLLPLSYLHGQERHRLNVFHDPAYPLARVHVFTRYILFGDPVWFDGKYGTGYIAFAWFVWEKNRNGIEPRYPTIHHIDNNQYVLSSSSLRERRQAYHDGSEDFLTREPS